MRKTIFIFFMMILSGISLYSQFPGLNYNTFINAYIEYTGMYNNIPKETLDILTSSEQMNKLFDDGIKSFTFR